jgi:hypothetical protein
MPHGILAPPLPVRRLAAVYGTVRKTAQVGKMLLG